ncbi:15243_t:CDS:1, partial [Funneliformis geosporum]
FTDMIAKVTGVFIFKGCLFLRFYGNDSKIDTEYLEELFKNFIFCFAKDFEQ